MADTERRKVEFNDLDDVISDIENLAHGDVRVIGNHSFAAIVQHLARANEMVVGDIKPPKLPLLMRLAMPFLKNSIFNNPAKPGFKLPTSDMQSFFWQENDISVSEAVEKFKASVARYNEVGPLPIHPIFGKATSEQVYRLLVSHAAMHLSFVHPV